MTINATIAQSCAVRFGVAYIALIYTAIMGGQPSIIQQPNATFADQFGFILRNGLTANYYNNLAMFSAQSNGSFARSFCAPTTDRATSACLRAHLAAMSTDIQLRATQTCGHIIAISDPASANTIDVLIRGDDGSTMVINIRGDDQDVLARLGPEFWYETSDPMMSSAPIAFMSAMFVALAALVAQA